jgi:S-layer protein
VIFNVFNNLAALTGDAKWGGTATLLANKVAYAQYYTEELLRGGETSPSLSALQAVIANVTSTTAIDAASIAAVLNPPAAPVNQSFELKTGVDNFTGGAGNDTFSAANGTLTGADSLDGAAGSDTLFVVSNGAFTVPVGISVKNIENVTVSGGSTVVLDATASAFNSGVTDSVSVSSTGGATVTAASTANVTVVESAVTAADGNVTVLGGKNVTVTSSGTTTNADAGAEISVGSATKGATGTVTVSSSFTGANTEVAPDISVNGGTTVAVTQSLGNAVNTTNTHGTVTVTGSASTTSVTVTQDKAATAAASVVGKVNGAVTINDLNATSTTKAGTITQVTLNNYGNSTIDSNGLAVVNLTGTGGTLGITTDSRTVPTATTLAINVNGLTGGAVTVDSDVTTLNIGSSTAASTIANVTAAGATSVNVTGDKALTLTNNTFGAATSIVVTNTAGATLGTTAIGAGVAFTGGTGADSVILSNAFTKAINMGDGDDAVTYGGAAGTGGSVAAGAGVDTISMTALEAAAADNDATFNSKFTGFEVLSLGASGANTIVLAGINAVNSVSTGGATGALVLDGYTSGGSLKLTADVGVGGSYQANVSNALFNAGDTFNINLSKSTLLAAGSVTVGGVETINITAADAASAGSAAVVHTATLVATGATTINVSGNNGLNLTNTGNTAVTKFDASNVAGNGTADTAANLGVTFTSANITTSATVTILGGAGGDTLTGAAAKDNITGGLGADVVRGGLGQDTVNVGSGRDIIKIVSDADTSATAYSESTTAAADIVNGFVLSTAIATGTDLSTAANFRASSAGGANNAMLSIDLNSDDAGVGAGINLAVAIEANATSLAGQAAGVNYTVTNGMLTLSGSGASNVDTLAEWLTEAAAVAATAGETIGFVFGSDTYVFAQNAAVDVLVQLVGVSASSLVLAGVGTTASAGAVIIGDGL